MKLPKFKKGAGERSSLLATFQSRTFRVGGYSVAAVAIVLAMVIFVNVIVGALPTSWTQFDTTPQKLFTISEQTKQIVGGLDEEIHIYWITRSGFEDGAVESLLDRYAALSSNLLVEKKDPDVFPTFLNQYVTGNVSENSLIVESGRRYRYVDYYEIYEYDYTNYYYNGTYDVSFAGEKALTSAIDYVISEDLPKIYNLTGHGEDTLASTFHTAVEDENIEMEDLSLLTLEAVPEDAAAILINGPQSDLSAKERDMLLAYLQSGGNMMLITDPPQNGALTNLEAVMENYGVTAAEGVVLEGDQNYYAFGTPYYLLPGIASHTITTPLKNSGYYVAMPVSQGLTVAEELRDTVSVTKLLTTSDSAFSKLAGYSLSTYEKEDGDVDGPFALAVAVTETLDSGAEANVVWVSSGELLDENANAQVSGGNLDFFLNGLNWMCGESEESISIHAKSLSYDYLTMDSGTVALLTILVVGIVPLGYLTIGIVILVRRKRR